VAADDVAVPTQDRVGGDQQPQSLAPRSRFHAEQGRVRSADEILGTHKVDACAGIVSEGWTNAAPTLPANGTRYGPIFAVTTWCSTARLEWNVTPRAATAGWRPSSAGSSVSMVTLELGTMSPTRCGALICQPR
jgi:hypothetical protein